MSIYFVPTLLALLFKLVVLAYASKGKQVSVMFLSLVTVFAAHNAIEVFGYFQFIAGNAIDFLFRLYYVCTVYVLLFMLLHGLTVSKLKNIATVATLTTIATLLAGSILFSDVIVAGQYSIGYSVTAIKGPHYWVFISYLLIILSSNLAVLLYGHQVAKSQLDSVRCIHSLVALTPIMIVLVAAIALKIANAHINAAGIAPIATTIFLAIILKTESKHKLSDIRRYLPLSPEREITANIMDLVDNYVNDHGKRVSYKDLQDGLEKEIICYSLKKCDNNVIQTAKMMSLSNRSTLYSMMSRLNIDMKEIKKTSS